MDREQRYGIKQRYNHCKNSDRTFENELVARLRQISLTSTLRDTRCCKERGHDCCRSYSAGKSLLRSEICRASTCNSSSLFPRVCDSRYFGMVRDLPCVHLCIIGKKMTLHKRNHDQNSFFVRAKNYSRRLKERSYAMQQQYRVINQNTAPPSNGNRCQNDACRHKLPYLHVPQVTDILPMHSQSSSDSDKGAEDHRYVLYHRRSTVQDDSVMSVLLPKELVIGNEKNSRIEHRQSITGRLDSGCISHLSFSSVDLTTMCRTPDDSSRIASPLPPKVKGLYPVACPAYPMVESFPVCVIPEPDV